MDIEVHELVLPPVLVEVLSRLVDDLARMHEDPPADDPVWDRLYPSASPGAEDDAAIRELVHPDLVERRRASLVTIRDHLQGTRETDEGAVVLLDDEQCVAFLGAVNDVRLALAVRVDPGLFSDPDVEWPPRRPSVSERVMLELVDHLAWLQEEVLAAIDPETQAHYDTIGPSDNDDNDGGEGGEGGSDGDDAG